jgi:hypothetical protein
MSKALRTVGMIAGVVALAATGAGLFAAPGMIVGVAGIGSSAAIASAATAVAALSQVGAQLLAKKPGAQGSVSEVIIGANAPQPYAMGRTYVGGNRMLEKGYGGTLSDVKNPYKSLVHVLSGSGPIHSIEAFQADFTTVSFSGGNAVSYYHDFLYLDTQLGASPEGTALTGPFGAIPSWGSSSKLSGYAAVLITAKFDKKAKRFASGLPQFGAIIKAVLAYDPRLDSTYPGGSGSHRALDETTYAWTENVSLHATTYALGRWQGISEEKKKVFGVGFTADSIDWPAWVEFANLCDANGWKVGGVIYEGPGISKWDNLKRICAAGGAEPVFVGAKLSVKFDAPRVALDTITADDLAGGEDTIPAMRTWRDRKNGIIPRYRSEAHKWEYVQSDLVSIPEYVEEDGEEKNEERQYDLVQDKDQAAELAAYELVNGREFGPIIIACKPRLIEYVPGEAVAVDIPEYGLNDQLCLIVGRKVDAGTGIVELTLISETTAKHAFALGQTGTAPPTPSITTGEELDVIATVTGANTISLIATSSIIDADPADGLMTATNTTITIEAHSRRYDDQTVSINAGTLSTVAASGALNHVYYDDPDRLGGAVTYIATTDPYTAANSPANPYRHYVGSIVTDTVGGTGTSGGGATPAGWDRGYYYNEP